MAFVLVLAEEDDPVWQPLAKIVYRFIKILHLTVSLKVGITIEPSAPRGGIGAGLFADGIAAFAFGGIGAGRLTGEGLFLKIHI